MNYKEEAAKKAMTFIAGKSTIGLGAGSCIACLIKHLQLEIENGLDVSFVTSSFSTLQLLRSNHYAVQSLNAISELDIYFDGCDQFDQNLHALKSGGGIHTLEKLCASMAKQFILIGDETKYTPSFDVRYPLVVEVIPEAYNFVPDVIAKHFTGATTAFRFADKKDGPVITSNGNYLLDIWFHSWPDLSQINPVLKNIAGVLETSLFYGMAHMAVIAGESGVQVLQKPGHEMTNK